ncbi:MAG: ThiF family adenylyltransferase [Candidatus Riflebacteria bacterium]|nr:ThiF family adenylyltransferase [Candidatus Riflebacteria bacterium]
MEGPRVHEETYRSRELMEKLAATRLVLCGAGAVGSNLAVNLVRQGFTRVRVIDDDRVGQRNLSTQTYSRADVGALKVVALKNDLFRTVGVEIDAVSQRLTEANALRLLKGASVVVDGFDNAASRALVRDAVRLNAIPCLHVGLSADYAEVIWDPSYRVPSGRGEDVCDYPLARNLIQLACAVASEVLVDVVAGNPPSSYTITLRDLSVTTFE